MRGTIAAVPGPSMSFAVRILSISAVRPVENSNFLTVNRILGYDAVTNRHPDGDARFEAGERVVYVPEGAQVPKELLQEHGYWDVESGKGKLGGPGGDVLRPVTLRGQLSQGLVWKLPAALAHLPDGTDVAKVFGIVQYVPVVPEELLRVCRPLFAAKVNYEIERYKTYPTLLEGDEVAITEKLEGECLQLTWMGGERHDGLFLDGRVAISTKGLGHQGLVFLDNDETREIPVVRAALASDLPAKVAELATRFGGNPRVALLGEAVGPGVKKLHYAGKSPFARGFDVRVETEWLGEDAKAESFRGAGVERVPLLWRGTFDPAVVEDLRQGQTTIGGAHIREGVVITATGSQATRRTPLGDSIRPILKAHSDAFLKKFGKDD